MNDMGRGSSVRARRTRRWLLAASLMTPAFGLACEEDSPTEPEVPDDLLEAFVRGDRTFDYEGSARFFLDEGTTRFVLESEGRGPFEGASIKFLANFQGPAELEVYSLGPPPGPDDEESDFSTELRTHTAIFAATEGSLEITSLTDEEMEGMFTFSAVRTHVCGAVTGNCEALPGGDPPVIDVEGTFIAIPPEGLEGS